MNLGWSGGVGSYEHPETHPDTMIQITDPNNHFVGSKLHEVLEELFQSGNNVKKNVVTALLSKDNTLPINNNSSWGSIVTQIGNIQAGLTLIAGDHYIYVHPSSIDLSNNTAYTKMLEFQFKTSGTVRVRFNLRASTGRRAYARMRINDIEVGIERTTTSTTPVLYIEDIPISAGDKLQLYLKTETSYSSGTFVTDFGLGIAVDNTLFFKRI